MSYLVERTIEVRGSNSVIGKIYIECLLSTVLKRCRNRPFLKEVSFAALVLMNIFKNQEQETANIICMEMVMH